MNYNLVVVLLDRKVMNLAWETFFDMTHVHYRKSEFFTSTWSSELPEKSKLKLGTGTKNMFCLVPVPISNLNR